MLASTLPNAPLSKFAFCDLVLASTLELEKARISRPANPEPLQRLANALSRAASPVSDGAPSTFVEAGYFVPFERLYTAFRSEQPGSIKQIQDFVQEATSDMRSSEVGGTSNDSILRLISFCVALHEELVRGLEAENAVVISESRASNKSAEAYFS